MAVFRLQSKAKLHYSVPRGETEHRQVPVVVSGGTAIAIRPDFVRGAYVLEGATKWNIAARSTAAKGVAHRPQIEER
jgi:hypothetical protein